MELSTIAPLNSESEVEFREFFERQKLSFNGLELRASRGERFTDLLRLQNADHETYVASEGLRVRASLSLSSGPRWVKNRLANVAFVGDFRIDGSRVARRGWRTILKSTFSKYASKMGERAPEIHLAAIALENRAARDIVKPKRPVEHRFHLLRRFRVVNLFARKPHGSAKDFVANVPKSVEKLAIGLSKGQRAWEETLLSRSKENLRVEFASMYDEMALRSFLETSEKKKFAGFDFGYDMHNEWDRRRAEWPGFSIGRFVIVKKGSEIVACALPWSPGEAKKMIFHGAPAVFVWGFRLLRKLGFRVPVPQADLKTLYLTTMNVSDDVDASSAVHLIANFIFQRGLHLPYHVVAFADWWNVSDHFTDYFAQAMSVGLFRITFDDAPVAEVKEPVGFEIATV